MKKIEEEIWKVITFHKSALGKRYAISNMGRLVCFDKEPNDGVLLKGSLQEGYPIWRFTKKKKNGDLTYRGILLHRLIAEEFLPPAKKDQTVVIHLNYKKADNRHDNLAWASVTEAAAHAQESPSVIKSRKTARKTGIGGNTKLTLDKVKSIKKQLAKGITLKALAVKYEVSDMQIHRIKTGENWGDVN